MTRLIFLLALLMLSLECFGGVNTQEDERYETVSIQYPTVYASMGTPLYERLFLFQEYAYLGNMKALSGEYEEFMLPVFQMGIELSYKEKLRGVEYKTYLKRLRALEAEKKRIMHHLTTLTMKAVDEDDIQSFEHLILLPLDELLPTMSTRTKAINYYKAKGHSKIVSIETLAVEVEKHRKARRKKQRSCDVIDDGSPRKYRLVNHLPKRDCDTGRSQNDEVETMQNSAQKGEGDVSTLKKIGNIFKSMGIDFDPSLMEEYKAHKPPSVDDLK